MDDSKITDFEDILRDFLKDLETTFPEYEAQWNIIKSSKPKQVFDYCVNIYPERFFDILYQNEDIFKEEENINTFFLPSMDFKIIFNDQGVSENSKKTIWKYLQLILFLIVNCVKDKNDFGECMNIFQGIDEDTLQSKLNETMSGINEFFENIKSSQEDSETNDNGNDENTEQTKSNFAPNMPDMDSLKDHLNTLFNGKIGSLAKEMAEEISDEFIELMGIDVNPDSMDTKDVLKNVMKNPKKIMELMKKVTTKLEERMKSGDISKDEIMREASDIMGKMKEMGGGNQFNDLMRNLTKGMGGLGKGAKFNKGAFNTMQKEFEQRERLREKLKKRKEAKIMKTGENNSIFKIDSEEQEKSKVLKAQNAEKELEKLIALEESEKQKNSTQIKTTKKKKKKKKN
jgi:hypothetical protein